MTKLRSFLYLLIIFLTISSLSYGEENPKKWYTGIIQPTALELQQAGDSLHIQYFTTLIIYKSAPIIL